MKPKVYHCLLLIVIAFAAGCKQEKEQPPASKVPAIQFKGLIKYTAIPLRISLGTPIGDSIIIVIRYEDGDGDLGLSQDDVTERHNKYELNEANFRYFTNYYLDLERKVNGVYQPVVFPVLVDWYRFSYWGVFPRTSDPKDDLPIHPFAVRASSPWRGELTYRITMEPPVNPSADYLRVGDTLRGRVQIADRALNVSNTIETPEFVLMR